MKKTYSKPDIAFESFSLATNIAVGGCTNVAGNFAPGDCAINFAGRFVFLDGVAGCMTEGAKVVEDGSPIANYLCYHVPTERTSVFNS
ncbi:MAG: hypothetical protein IJV82_06450 [Oscillospiraceae bacterium]|nr:hypothetical protein [Oscillospiraceae bacterium]